MPLPTSQCTATAPCAPLCSWNLWADLELEGAPAPASVPAPQRRSRASPAAPPTSGGTRRGGKRSAAEAELEPWATDSEAEEEGRLAAAPPSSGAGRRGTKRSRSNAGDRLAALIQQEQAADSEAEEEGRPAAAPPSSGAGRRGTKRSRAAAAGAAAGSEPAEAPLEHLASIAVVALEEAEAEQQARQAAGSSEEAQQVAGSSEQASQPAAPAHMAATRARAAAFLAKNQQKIANTRNPKGESKQFAVGDAVLLFPSDLGRNGSLNMATYTIPCRIVRPSRNGTYRLQCNAGVLEGSYDRNDLRKANAESEKRLAFGAAEVGNAETIALSAAVAAMGGRMTDVRCGCRGKCGDSCACKRVGARCGSHCKCCHGKQGKNCGNSKAPGAGKRRKA